MKLNFLFFMVVLLAQQTIAQTSVSFYLTPSISAQELKTHGNLIKEYLTKETGLNIDLKIPTSYDNLVEDFGKNKSCFAFMSSQSYVLANEKYKASVRLRIVRYGHSTYQGMIVTHVSSGIKKLADLENKSFAYTDALSTSGYLYPKMMMQRANVNPSKEVYLSKHDEVIRQVYEKKVDAGAAYYSEPSANGAIRDARAKLKEKYPDIEKQVLILLKTDPIPNDPVVFSHDFAAADATKICMALMKLSKDPKGKEALVSLYGTEGFVKASDADYNTIRSMMIASK